MESQLKLRMLRHVGIALAFALSPITFVTAPAIADQAYDSCLNDSDGTNTAWGECGGEYLSRLDDQLNRAWKATFPLMSDESKVLLREEQRAWNAFKESSCLYYETGDYGREGQVLEMPACRGEIIEQRIMYLDALRGDDETN